MSIRKLELIFAAITLAAFILTVALPPGINMLNVIGLNTIALLYVIGGTNIFGTLNKPAGAAVSELAEAKPPTRFLPLLHFVFALPCIAMIFKLQSWPSADTFLYAAIGALVITALAVGNNYIKTSYFNPAIVKRIIIYATCCLILLLLPKYALIDVKYRNHPAYRDALKNSIEHPGDTSLSNKANRERLKMGGQNN